MLYDMESVLARHFDAVSSSVTVSGSISLDPLQEKIVALCTQSEMSLVELIEQSDTDAAQVLQALTGLEIHGLVVQSAPDIYRCAQKIAKGH